MGDDILQATGYVAYQLYDYWIMGENILQAAGHATYDVVELRVSTLKLQYALIYFLRWDVVASFSIVTEQLQRCLPIEELRGGAKV